MAELWAEIKTLFWLQGRLTLSIFRRRSTVEGWARIGSMVAKVLQLVFSLPIFLLMGAALAVGMILLSPRAAYELAIMVNTAMLLIWLLLPSSYNTQMVERFEMSRLFAHPVSFRGMVVGSTLMAMLSMTGLWTVPMLLGQVVGFAWHAPLALPLILLGALPALTILALAGRIMEDFFDLVAGDRRLRALMILILMAPFGLLYLLQYYFQFASNNLQQLPGLVQRWLTPDMMEALSRARGPSDVLEALGPSRFLIWLPPGWVTASMGLPSMGPPSMGPPSMGLGGLGQVGRALGFLGLSVAFAGGLLWVHAGITRWLMRGTSLTLGAERVRARRLGLRLPGPPAFWALFHKDWLYLWRSPIPRRMLFVAPLAVVGMIPAMAQLPTKATPITALLPAILALFLVVLLGMMLNMNLTANYFGAMDREGFATLAYSPLDRRYVLISANLAVTLFVMAIYLVLMVVIGSLSGRWEVVPLGLYTGLCLQISTAPAYNLAAIIGPYRAQLKWQGRQRGTLWGMIGLLAAPPVVAMLFLPYALWRPGLLLAVPLAAVYSVGVYALTLKPLARWLQRREYRILAAITSDE